MSELTLTSINKTYTNGDEPLTVLNDLNLTLKPGETTALFAPSGSGKSTLLHIAGLLDKPTKGTVSLDGVNVWSLADTQRTAIRRQHLGFVYQFHHLLSELTALENAALPLMLAQVPSKQAKAEAETLLTSLGLAHRLNHRPARLSGGERQRVAFARALIHKPKFILMDEPTGNLDPASSKQLMDVLHRAIDTGMGALIATHNPELAQTMTRRLTLTQGTLQSLA